MNFQRSSDGNESRDNDKAATEGQLPPIAFDVPLHPRRVSPVSTVPDRQNFPQSVAFLWQVLNDMGLVETSRALRDELNGTGFSKDIPLSPSTSIGDNSSTNRHDTISNTVEMGKTVNDPGIEVTKRRQSFLLPQDLSSPLAGATEKDANSTTNPCEDHHPTASTSNFSFHALLERVLEGKLGKEKRQIMNIVQILSYYTVEPLTGALSSFEHSRRGSLGSGDETLNSIGQVNCVINALSDLYDDLTAVSLANNDANGLDCEDSEKNTLSPSLQPLVLKKVFLQYCSILLLQQSLSESMIIGDITSPWTACSAGVFQLESSPQPSDKASVTKDSIPQNNNSDDATKAGKNSHRASSSGQHTTASNGKPKPRTKRRSPLPTKSTTLEEVHDSNQNISHDRPALAYSLASNEEENTHTTKEQQRSFHLHNSPPHTVQSLLQRNVFQCACHILSCTHSLHMTLAAHHAHHNRTQPKEFPEANPYLSGGQNSDKVDHAHSPFHDTPAIELVEQALELMKMASGMWKRRAELVLRQVLQRSSLCHSISSSAAPVPFYPSHDPDVCQSRPEMDKELSARRKKTTTLEVNGRPDVLSSIQAVMDGCHVPVFQGNNKLDTGVSNEQSEIYIGMETLFLPRCPSCVKKQRDSGMAKSNNEDMTEDKEKRNVQEKIAFVRIWNVADRARNILWMLQSVEEHVRLMYLAMKSVHASAERLKALEEAISICEGQWAAHCANTLRQTLLLQSDHGVAAAAANIKEVDQDRNNKVKTSSCFTSCGHLEYRRHRYERLFTSSSSSASDAVVKKFTTEGMSTSLEADHIIQENQIHDDGAAACRRMSYSSPLDESRRHSMTDNDMDGKTLWEVFLDSVYALTDGFCSAAIQLLQEGSIFGTDAIPLQRVEEGTRTQREEAPTLADSVAGWGGDSDDSHLARVQQERRSCVYAQLFSNFVPFSKRCQVGLIRSKRYHPLGRSTKQGTPSCSDGRSPSSFLFKEKEGVSEVFPYAVDMNLACEATPQHPYSVNCKEWPKHGQLYRDSSPDDWTMRHGDVMGRALHAVMRSLQIGRLVNSIHRSRRVRPLRHRLRRALAHQHVVLNSQFSDLPFKLQIRALQNPRVLEATKPKVSENSLGLESIAGELSNVSVVNRAAHNHTTNEIETVTSMPNILKISETDKGDLSSSAEATQMPTAAVAATAGPDISALSVREQTSTPAHLSNVSQSQDEEANVNHSSRQQQNVSQNTRFTSPAFATIRHIAQDIGITVERAIMTSDLMGWRNEGGVVPSESAPSFLPNAGDQARHRPSLPRQQTLPYHVGNAVANHSTAAEEEEEEDSDASDASSSVNHFNRAVDEIAEEVQQITVTPCGTLVAFVTTRARLVVYSLRAHAKESVYKEELLVDTVLPGTPKHPHWYEAHSAITRFSPDGRFVLAAVQFMPRGVDEGEEEEESRVIPVSTGQISIFSLHKERYGATTSSANTVQQGFTSSSRKPFKRLFQLPNRLYATWKIHSAPITAAHWADPRFWGGGWTSPQYAFLDLMVNDKSATVPINRQSSVSGYQNGEKNTAEGPRVCCEFLRASSEAWHIAAQARLAVFQCFSTALDNLILRWLPCSGVLVQRISTMPVQDLIVSPLMNALYTIDDKGFLSMYDAWYEGEGSKSKDLRNSSSITASNINVPSTILIGERGLPDSSALLQTSKEKASPSSRRQPKIVSDQELPHALFCGTHIIRFDRSGIIARHHINSEYLAETNSNSSPSVLVGGRRGNQADKSGTGAINYLSRFLRFSLMGEAKPGGSVEASNDEEVSLLSQGMSFYRSAQMGRKLIQNVLAEQVSNPTPKSVFLCPSSTSTSQSNTDSESNNEEEEYCRAGVPVLNSGLQPYSYSQYDENGKSVGGSPSLNQIPEVSPSHEQKDVNGIPNAFYKSGSRLVFAEIGRSLCLSGNIPPARHSIHIENGGVSYHLLSLALSGQPQWGTAQHKNTNFIDIEEAKYRALIRLWKSRKLRDLNLPQTMGSYHDSQEGCKPDDKGSDGDGVIGIDEILSISYFTDDHTRGGMAYDDTTLSPSKRSRDHDNSKMRGERDDRSGRSLEFGIGSILSLKLHLEPTARNGRYLALMASIGPYRVLIDRAKPLEHRPGLYGCLIFDTYMSHVLRVVAVCPVQPVTSLTLNGTIPKHSDAKKMPIFSLQCSLTVINQKRAGKRDSGASGTHTHSWYRKTDPEKSIAHDPNQILAPQGMEADDEKVILTVGGLHNTLYIFDALSGDRIRTVTLRESDFARMIQASRTRAMGGVPTPDSHGEELNWNSTFLSSQPMDQSNCCNIDCKSTVATKQEKTGVFRHMRGPNFKASVKDVLYSLSTWDRFEGQDTTAYCISKKADSGRRRGRHIESTTSVINYEGVDKIWFQMADLSEGDHIGSTTEEEDETEGKGSNEEAATGRGRLGMHSHGTQHRKQRSRHRLVDQLVQRYGLPFVLYAQQCLMSVICWPSEMRGHLLNDTFDITVSDQKLRENISQREDRASCLKTPKPNPDLQTLFSPLGGMSEGRILLTTMVDLSHRLRMDKVSQKCASPLFLSGRRGHPDECCGGMFHSNTTYFDEPFKLAVEQLMELSYAMHTNTCGKKGSSGNATSSPIAEMVSEICSINPSLEEAQHQDGSTNNHDTQGNSQQHPHCIIDTNSNVRDPEHIFEDILDNVYSGNNNKNLLHCGVVNAVATWWSEEHCGIEPKRGAFHVLASTESGQLHIVGGLL